jgi:hypothetical protein
MEHGDLVTANLTGNERREYRERLFERQENSIFNITNHSLTIASAIRARTAVSPVSPASGVLCNTL